MSDNNSVGFGLVKKHLPQMAAYVAFIVLIVLFKPPIYITALLLTVYVFVKMNLAKRFKWKWFFKTCAFIYTFLAVIYGIYYFIGGWTAIITAHLIGITLIAKAQWRFIKKCDQQIKKQLDIIINKQKK